MKSISFPNMFTRTVTNLTTDYDATLENLTLLLNSEKGGLFGDPYYGTNIRKYLFDQNDSIVQDILIDEIYTSVKTFMPQLSLERKNVYIISDGAKVTCTIQAINRSNFKTNLYNIVLLDTVA